MTKHYIEYWYAGGFMSESTVKEVKVRDKVVELPKRAYAYNYFDQEEIEVGGEILKGKPKNISHRYIRGEVYDIQRVEKEVPNNSILLSNMRGNKWPKVIKCHQGFLPMEKGDVFI